MSAICCNQGWCAVNDGALKSTAPSITARPTPQEKRLFAEVAAKLASIGVDAGADRHSHIARFGCRPTCRHGHRAAIQPWTGSRSVCGREIDSPSGSGRLSAA